MSRPLDPVKRARRLPPVRLDVLYDLYRYDPSRTLLYLIAAAEGRSMKANGTFDKPAHDESYVGVWVGKDHRNRILATLDMQPQRWRSAVRYWVELGLAHRCGSNGVFLLRVPGMACPRCTESVALSNGKALLSATVSVPVSNGFRHELGDTNGDIERGQGVVDSKPEVPEVPEVLVQEGVQAGISKTAALRENGTDPFGTNEVWERLHPDETQEAR